LHYRIKIRHTKQQNGLALITVLFIFALVSMLAVSIQTQQEHTIRQASASLLNTQKFITLISIEDIAKAGLMYDNKRDTDANEHWDTASELWNKPFPLKLESAIVNIYIRDLQGLFNLNSLHPKNASHQVAKARFKRLIEELGITTGVEDNLVQWFTEDSSANYDYQNKSPAYSASEIIFSHPSELLLVEGMDMESYLKLEPYITALPMDAPLNINTTYPEILASWDLKLTSTQAKVITDKTRSKNCGPIDRNNFVFTDIDSLFEEAEIKDLTDTTKNPDGEWDKGDFDVKTKYFSVLSSVKLDIDGDEMVLESIIKRDSENDFIGAIYRDFSRKPDDIFRLVKTMNCGA